MVPSCDADPLWAGARYASTASTFASSDDGTTGDDYSPASSILPRASSTSSGSNLEAICTTTLQKTENRQAPRCRSDHNQWLRNIRQAAATTTLLPASRPCSRLPTALLLSSRTIYHESRTLPYSTNEFVFPSWFTSGLCSATNFFTTNLVTDWQRDSVRWVRIEVLSKDLGAVSVASFEEGGSVQTPLSSTSGWVQLCQSMTRGVRGLRVKILATERVWFGAAWDDAPTGLGTDDVTVVEVPSSSSSTTTTTTTTTVTAAGDRHAGHGGLSTTTETGSDHPMGMTASKQRLACESDGPPRGIVSIFGPEGQPQPWITRGLALLKGLRRLEVELCPTTRLTTAAASAERAVRSGDVLDEGEEDSGARVGSLASVLREETRLKISWCTNLQNVLNDLMDAGEEPLSVVCTAKDNTA